MPSLDDLATLVALGGPVFLVLLVVSIGATALVLHKVVRLAHSRAGRFEAARTAVDHWVRGDPVAALSAAEADRAPSAVVIAAAIGGLMREGADAAAVKEDAGRIATGELARLQLHLRPLDAIVQVAPLLGLFGTVVGMIETFAAMEEAGGAVVPADLAGGIWVALLTTGFGLAIAIPLSGLLAWFDGIDERERAAMESLLTALFTRLAAEPAPERLAAAVASAPAPASAAASAETVWRPQ
jgi:biopolymer transport protein ExbB